MILWAVKAALAAALTVLVTAPAYADVMQIDDGNARWVASRHLLRAPNSHAANPQATNPPVTNLQAPGHTLTEIPAEAALFPEAAIALPARHAQFVPPAYAAKVAELSARFDLSPALIEALVWQESRWRTNAVSSAGARGLAQLMPGTARELGVNADDPFANLEGGARYLRTQIDRFGGDIEKALAAYNAGPARVIRAGGIPRIRETQTYVASIMGRLSNHSRSSQ